jgi:hypothetical protein
MPHAALYSTLKKFCDDGQTVIYLEDISQVTFVSTRFFQIFPEKITGLKEILKAGFDS